MKAALTVFFISASALIAAEPTKFPRTISDPFAAFVQTCGDDFPFAPGIREIHYDFDADGIQDIAFTVASSGGHRGNFVWDVFLRRKDGRFVEVGYITYRLHLKVIPAKGGGSFVHTFIVGSAGHDVILSYRITKRGITKLPEEGVDIENAADIRQFE